MRRSDGLALAALALAIASLLGPALFGTRTAVTWNMDLWHPWAATALPADLARPGRFSDSARQFYPMCHLLDQAIDSGRIPLWNRWIFCGTPFLANLQPGVFYPPNLLLAGSGLDVPRQLSTSLALHLFWGAAGTWLLLRRLGAGSPAALLGAVTFAGGGFWSARAPTMVAGGAWLPWALLASRRWFARRDGASFAGMALALGLSGLAGHAQIFVFVAYAWGLFGIVEGLARRPRTRGSTWAGWAGAGLLGLLLVSVQVVPALELARRGTEPTSSAQTLASGTLHPWAVAKLVVPDLLGHPRSGNHAEWMLRTGNGHYAQTEHSTAVYAGILPLLLASTMLLSPGDRRRETLFALLLVAFGTLLSLHTPLLAALTRLPAHNFSRPDRAVFLAGFGVALLAGLAADRLAGREGPGLRRPANALALALAAAALALALAGVGAGAEMLPEEVGRALGDAWVRRVAATAAGVVAVSAGLFGLRALGRIAGRTFLALAVVVVAADVGTYAARMNLMQPSAAVYRPPSPGGALEFLQRRRDAEGPFRIFRFEPGRTQFRGVLPPATAAPYGLEDVLGFDSLDIAHTRELLAALDPDLGVRRGNVRGSTRPEVMASPLLDLLDVRYVLAEPTVPEGALPGLKLVHRSDLAVFENPDRLPRAFLVDEVHVLRTAEGVLQAMASPSFRPDRRAYAERPVPGLDAAVPGAPRPPAGEARLVSHADERVQVEVRPARPALLVLADAEYPGWKASVDGVARPIHRVDHALRGVVVRPGDREVVFEYRPVSFRIGAALSLGAAVALAAIASRLGRGAAAGEARA
jgi:hypothetical protein